MDFKGNPNSCLQTKGWGEACHHLPSSPPCPNPSLTHNQLQHAFPEHLEDQKHWRAELFASTLSCPPLHTSPLEKELGQLCVSAPSFPQQPRKHFSLDHVHTGAATQPSLLWPTLSSAPASSHNHFGFGTPLEL